jgi:hypothetical protein
MRLHRLVALVACLLGTGCGAPHIASSSRSIALTAGGAGVEGIVGGDPWKGWSALAHATLESPAERLVVVYPAEWTCQDAWEWSEPSSAPRPPSATPHGVHVHVLWVDGFRSTSPEGEFDEQRSIQGGEVALSLDEGADRAALTVSLRGADRRVDSVAGTIEVVDCGAHAAHAR